MDSYFTWNIDPEIISFFFVSFRWYGLFFGLSFVFGMYFMGHIFESEGKNNEDLDPLLIHIMLGTIIGAKLFHVIFYNPVYYLNHPLSIIKVWEGGLASHGGGIGIIVGIYFFKRRREGYSFLWITDRLSIPVILGGTLIRTGNFFNSEIVGHPSNYPWSVIFSRIDNIPRHPSQLYESLLYLTIFLLLFFLYRKTTMKNLNGVFTGIFLTLVFTGRFFLEFLKMKQESYDTFIALNTGQLLSLPFIIVGIILILKGQKEVKQ